ncbi:MAG: tyrosine-type recombinase/integrase [Acidobacteriaceae bacterium]
MIYQKGTVYVKGTREKKWYGKFRVYLRDKNGQEVEHTRKVVLGPKAQMRKFEAERRLQEVIRKANESPDKVVDDRTVTFGWFLEERYFPVKRGRWRPATKRTAEYEIRRHLLSRFKEKPMCEVTYFDLQLVLNQLAEGYAESTVKHIYAYSKGIMRMARKLKFVGENPADDLQLPEMKPVDRPTLTQEQILSLLSAIKDIHDFALVCVALFCGTRTGETLGLQWKSYLGDCFVPFGIAYEGQFYAAKMKNDASRQAIPIPDRVRPILEAWKAACKDTSPEALIFSTSGRRKRTGKSVPWDGNNFLRTRIHPIAEKLGISKRLVTFQVMRRTLGTDLQRHGTMKDAQRILRHADINTTGNIYMQAIPTSVRQTLDARTGAVLGKKTLTLPTQTVPNGSKLGVLEIADAI